MLSYKIDKITKQVEDSVAYVHVMDGEKIVQTTSLVFKNKEDFKQDLKTKTAKIKLDYDKKELKKVEIEQALKEML